MKKIDVIAASDSFKDINLLKITKSLAFLVKSFYSNRKYVKETDEL